MTPVQTPLSDVEFVQAAIPLLTEYTDKLRELSHVAFKERTLRNDVSFVSGPGDLSLLIEDEAVRHLRSLKAPTEELARQASAVIDQGQLDKFNRVQLWLRLAEFEAAIQVANDILTNSKNKKK